MLAMEAFAKVFRSGQLMIIKLLPVLLGRFTLRTLEETKKSTFVRIYLEAKYRDNAYLCSRLYFYEETVSKAVLLRCQSKYGFFESDWPTAWKFLEHWRGYA